MVLAAIQAVHWVKNEKFKAGLEGLKRITPKMKDRTRERALASLKKRGIVESSRAFGAPSEFAIYLEDLSFEELRQALQLRQIGGNESATVAEQVRQIGGVIINRDSKDMTLDPKTLEGEAPSLPLLGAALDLKGLEGSAKKSKASGRHPLQSELWEAMKGPWSLYLLKASLPEVKLPWPKPEQGGRNFEATVASYLDDLGVEVLLGCWQNYLDDPHVQGARTPKAFFFDPFKYAKLREAFDKSKPASSARPFHNAEPSQTFNPGRQR